MSEKKTGLESYKRPDGIHVFKAYDLSKETMLEWERQVVAMLEKNRAEKRLYDLRGFTDIPLYAVRIAMRARRHRNVHFNYVVALLDDNLRMLGLIDLIMSIQPGGHFRIMTDEEEAVSWLNEQLSPPSESTEID